MRISHKRLTIWKTAFAVLLPIYGHKCWKKSSKIGRPDWTTSEPAVAAVAEWYRYRTVACFVTGSSPVPLKTRRVGQRCTLNLSRAETSSRWIQQPQKVFKPSTVFRHNFRCLNYASIKDYSQTIALSTAEKNPEGPELPQNGCKHDHHQNARQSRQIDHQVTTVVAKNDASLALSPRFRQVPIESPL
ncbi:uncharacterized protein TNCV_3274681 [Trichonephila clavipes]|nr:uncharacterized protein TNCV_3274681 [Trichonephila clavipes]